MNLKLEITCDQCNNKKEINLIKDSSNDIVLFESLNKSEKFIVKSICSNEVLVSCKNCNKKQIFSSEN